MNKFVYICCIIVFLLKTQTVFSNNLIYDVNNIKVSGVINNDSDKEKLLQSAFQKAFTIFINKTLLTKDSKNLYNTKINTINDLVFAYQVVKEKKKNKNKSIFTFNIKFDPKKINIFLAKNSIAYADVKNISLTLLPVLIKDKDILMFGDNFFYNNWLGPEIESKIESKNDILISYNLALENLEDLQYINLNKENIELIDVKKLMSLDGVENYAFLIIYFTEDKLRAYVKTSIENKEIDKNIDLNIYPQNEKKTYDEAILILKEQISQIWKGQNLIDVNTPSFLDLLLNVKQANDYLKLRSVFNSIDLIDNFSVLEMTSEYTKIRLKYKGKINKLKANLLAGDIKIKITDNIWSVTVN